MKRVESGKFQKEWHVQGAEVERLFQKLSEGKREAAEERESR